MSEVVAALRNVHFSYGSRRVFSDLTLEVRRGDYLGMIGPNGGGKSTALQLLLGLLTPDEGAALLFETPARAFREWSRVAYVAQSASHIDPSFPLTVRAVVTMGLHARRPRFGRASADDRARVDRAMALVGINDLADRRIGELSGGQRQRAFLARAIATEPELLLLDEPTTGVDRATQERLYELLRTLHRNTGLTLILTSHDSATIAREATIIAVLQQGLRFHGTPAQLLDHPDYNTIAREVACTHHH